MHFGRIIKSPENASSGCKCHFISVRCVRNFKLLKENVVAHLGGAYTPLVSDILWPFQFNEARATAHTVIG